jgi:hypothetical protein
VGLGQSSAFLLGFVEIGTVEYDFGAQAVDVEVLDRGGVERHDDGAGDAELPTREGDSLGVVACW